MTERMQGSSQSLPSKAWTPPRWRDVATELLAIDRALDRRARSKLLPPRRRSWRCEEALIRQDFAYRFHMAMQDTCAARRQATLALLTKEEQATLCQAREATLAEARSDRERHRSAIEARRWRVVNLARRPRRPRLRWPRSGRWFGSTPVS